MTLIAAAIIISFTTIEFFDYRRVNVDTSIVVDRSRGEKLTVNMNVTFPRVPCYRESSCLGFRTLRGINHGMRATNARELRSRLESVAFTLARLTCFPRRAMN